MKWVPHRWEPHKGSLHWCTQSVEACSVALSPLSRSTDPCQALTVRQAINSQTINHSSQGSQQHWARTLAHNIRAHVCVVPFLEPHVPDPCEDYRAAFGRKASSAPWAAAVVPDGEVRWWKMLMLRDTFTPRWADLCLMRSCAHTVCCHVGAGNKQSRQKQKRERGKAKPCN